MITKKSTQKRSKKKVLEKDIQSDILKYLRSVNIFAWRNNSGFVPIGGGYSQFGTYSAPRRMQVGKAGLPDILGILGQNTIYPGRFFAIEVKREGNTTTPLQDEQIAKINEAGGLAIVAFSQSEVEKVITRLLLNP